mmetsp:Transcript_17661/g.68549  ORF Transcript_17661/g.68549 Transcript_17661/m.68549 type:complete len:201 (-) Transcript_17661:206-808(-)
MCGTWAATTRRRDSLSPREPSHSTAMLQTSSVSSLSALPRRAAPPAWHPLSLSTTTSSQRGRTSWTFFTSPLLSTPAVAGALTGSTSGRCVTQTVTCGRSGTRNTLPLHWSSRLDRHRARDSEKPAHCTQRFSPVTNSSSTWSSTWATSSSALTTWCSTPALGSRTTAQRRTPPLVWTVAVTSSVSGSPPSRQPTFGNGL